MPASSAEDTGSKRMPTTTSKGGASSRVDSRALSPQLSPEDTVSTPPLRRNQAAFHIPLDALRRGDRGAVARAMNLIEDRRPSAQVAARTLLNQLAASSDAARGIRIGITGPPGAGKSTLLGALTHAIRQRGLSIGILAVDPSSPNTGGSLLGDRARLNLDPDDPELYFRSIATHGHVGGMSWSAPAAARVLRHAFDVVFLETTGVGQTEVEVRDLVDFVLLVVQPGSGDTLQFLKAGIMEIPDHLVVNKADLGALASRTFAELKRTQHMPVSLVSALGESGTSGEPANSGTSMDSSDTPNAKTAEGADLEADFDALVSALIAVKPKADEGTARFFAKLFAREHGESGVRTLGGLDAITDALRQSQAADPVGALSALYLARIRQSDLPEERT